MTEPLPSWFTARDDPRPDTDFYAVPRLVTHIDDAAIHAVGALYAELGLTGRVLDLMSSWVSHFRIPPAELVVLGLNAEELAANPMADRTLVHDLNTDTSLPLPDASFDAVVCTVSVDYLVRPVAVLAEVARVLRPGGICALTFSNRCFPTKAIRGWLSTDDETHCEIVETYLRMAGGFDEPTTTRSLRGGDPLFAVSARRTVASWD